MVSQTFQEGFLGIEPSIGSQGRRNTNMIIENSTVNEKGGSVVVPDVSISVQWATYYVVDTFTTLHLFRVLWCPLRNRSRRKGNLLLMRRMNRIDHWQVGRRRPLPQRQKTKVSQ